MSSFTPSARSQPPVRQAVYVRRRAAGALPINGERDGWRLDEHLLCTTIDTRAGVFGTSATFVLVPSSATELRIDFALKRYSTDDQVKVIAFPVTDEKIDPTVEPEKAPVLFEGILGRMQCNITTSSQGADEAVSFVAQPMCLLDDRLTEHLIVGRWMFDRETPTVAFGNKPMIAHSPELPAVFNFNGRPNQSRQLIATQMIAGTYTYAPVFTHDEDPDGKYWTVRTALASILVQWVYGASRRAKPDESDPQAISDAPALNRNICVDPALIAELDRDATAPGALPEHRLLGMQLPECNVQGLHALSAIEKVCQAAGMHMALDCVSASEFTEEVDRRYQLRVWATGQGPRKSFYLAKPGTTFADGERFFAANNIHAFTMLADGDNVVNEVFAAGQSSIEGAIVLKPGWKPEDVDAATIDRQLAHVDDRKLGGTAYHAKHVVGGALFNQYGHVGRLWIADCIGDPFGEAGTDFPGYSSGVYAHPDEGFDFVTALGANVPGNPVEQERATLGLYEPRLRWCNRVRRALPLRNPASQSVGQNYIVEVSEDAGATWKPLPFKVGFEREYFGIRLTGIDNLAAFSLNKRTACPVKESWWNLIKLELLSFRLTCTMRSDSGAAAYLQRRAASGSVYKRGQYIAPRGVDEVWQAPGSPVNPTSAVFRRVFGWGGYGSTTSTAGFDILNASTSLSDAAKLHQDANDQVRRSMRASLYLFNFGQYKLGDVITKIAGRDIPLGTNQGEGATFPNIVGITYVLAGADQQGITLTLTDQSLSGFRAKGGR